MKLPLTLHDCLSMYWKQETCTIADVKMRSNVSMISPDLHEFKYPKTGILSIGIDPGRNFGISIIHNSGLVEVMDGKFPKDADYGRMAYGIGLHLPESLVLIIEGAAYAKPFGQVMLSAIREGFRLGAHESGRHMRVEVVPPATARKVVFGHGKMGADKRFVTLNHNAADSFGLALVGMTMIN